MDWLGEYVKDALVGILRPLVNPGSFLSFLPLVIALVIAVAVLVWRVARKGRPIRLRRLARMVFPARIFLHPSAMADYKIFLINNGLLATVMASLLMTPMRVSGGLQQVLEMAGATAPATGAAGLAVQVAFTLVLVLAWDFAATFSHYLKHQVPALWEFHKIHHSAEVMTPMTAVRRHPMEDIFSAVITSLVLGVVMVVWQVLVGEGITPITVFGSWAGIYLWRLLGYNLRHSHIWISYGDFWNRIFISPAQHQIHHSTKPAHFNKNFGHIFSCWDALFGTLYLPRDEERVKFGIEAHEMPQFQTLSGIYLVPFVNVAKGLAGRLARPVRQD